MLVSIISLPRLCKDFARRYPKNERKYNLPVNINDRYLSLSYTFLFLQLYPLYDKYINCNFLFSLPCKLLYRDLYKHFTSRSSHNFSYIYFFIKSVFEILCVHYILFTFYSTAGVIGKTNLELQI